jgi:hypothetical protein
MAGLAALLRRELNIPAAQRERALQKQNAL